MARSREYFIERLKRDNFNTARIKESNDIDEILEIMIYNHIKEGHQLSKDDIGTLREVLRMFIADNEDQKKQDNGIIITTATQAIEAIDPKLISQSYKDKIVEFGAMIAEDVLEPENLGATASKVIVNEIHKAANRIREARGEEIDEEDSFDVDLFMSTPAGRAWECFGRSFARRLANKL